MLQEKEKCFVLYPEMEMHSPFRIYSMIILREEDTKESVENLIREWKLSEFAQQESLVIAFPNPPKEGWNSLSAEELTAKLREIQSKMCEPDDYVFETNEIGIPLLKCMLNRWHLMNDTRYYIGIGKACKAACTMARMAPIEVTAVCCIGECGVDYEVSDIKKLKEIGMPVLETMKATSQDSGADFLTGMYREFMKPIRRINTGKYGDTTHRMDFEKVGFDVYLNNTELGDQGGMAHTWFVHVPSTKKQSVKEQCKLPMMIFFHGGSDNPMEAADMSKFHELGEKEGFITVYPWGSDTASWNCNYEPDGFDDVAYTKALIQWMKEHYPVDESRIYLSGFSNGAAMAQIYAMEYPEEIAGVCHIDSNWPGHRLGLAKVDPPEGKAFQKAWKKKEESDYLMPVWYTYGTREPSYPVYKGCSQQLQYDFWKAYNHIPIAETPERETPHPCGCGVPGEVCEEQIPLQKYPEHRYQINRFYSEIEHLNLYNYVMMHDKGHEVAPSDPVLGWKYVKQFRREADGTLGNISQEERQ